MKRHTITDRDGFKTQTQLSETRSESGCEKENLLYVLVLGRIRTLRTRRHTSTELPKGPSVSNLPPSPPPTPHAPLQPIQTFLKPLHAL